LSVSDLEQAEAIRDYVEGYDIVSFTSPGVQEKLKLISDHVPENGWDFVPVEEGLNDFQAAQVEGVRNANLQAPFGERFKADYFPQIFFQTEDAPRLFLLFLKRNRAYQIMLQKLNDRLVDAVDSSETEDIIRLPRASNYN
jgi:hypothetical protein